MKLKRLIFLLALGISITACNNSNNQQRAKEETNMVNNKLTNLFTQIDSVEFYYYSKPQNQKENETFLIRDTLFINALASNLQLQTTEKKECGHFIKMYLFKKGDVYKTVYASVGGSCNYLAYAVNGKPFYAELSDSFKSEMQRLIPPIKQAD